MFFPYSRLLLKVPLLLQSTISRQKTAFITYFNGVYPYTNMKKIKKPLSDIILGLEAEKLVGATDRRTKGTSLLAPKAVYAKDLASAIKFQKSLKKPVVVKIISQGAIHKSDIGGVAVARDEKDIASQFDQIQNTIKKKKLKDAKIMIQEFVSGHETILGIKKDPTFGHVIMFGIGGKYVEIIKDVSFMACPLSEKDAEDMMEQLKFKPLLEGVRGNPAANKKAIAKVLVHVSHLAIKKNVQELDINPLIVDSKDAYAVDVRVVI